MEKPSEGEDHKDDYTFRAEPLLQDPTLDLRRGVERMVMPLENLTAEDVDFLIQIKARELARQGKRISLPPKRL